MTIIGKSFTTVALVVLFFLPASSYAQQLDPCVELGIACPEGDQASNAAKVITSLVQPLLYLVTAIAAALIMYGGVTYIMSTGDESKAAKAKNIIIFSIIGLVVIGVSGIVINAILSAAT